MESSDSAPAPLRKGVCFKGALAGFARMYVCVRVRRCRLPLESCTECVVSWRSMFDMR